MPATSSWYIRIPEILEQLRQLDTPVIDRQLCEILFGVRRRRTIELMQRFDGYKTGNTILLDRNGLIHSLERLQGSPEVERERRRKEKLARRLEELQRVRRATAVTLPINPQAAIACSFPVGQKKRRTGRDRRLPPVAAVWQSACGGTLQVL